MANYNVTIITNNHIEYIDLGNMAINTVRTLLNNPNWDTKNAY